MRLKDNNTGQPRQPPTTAVCALLLPLLFLLNLFLARLNPLIGVDAGTLPPKRSLSVTFPLGDETSPSFFIGNIPQHTPGFEPDLRSHKPRATLLDTTLGIAPRFLHLSDIGDLYTISVIDRDDVAGICGPLECCDEPLCNLTFSAIFIRVDSPNDPIEVTVTLQMLDANDNAPTFQDSSFLITIPEVTSSDALRQPRERVKYSLPRAIDKDSHPNSVVKYQLVGENENFLMTSPESSCYPCLELSNTIPLDFENPKHQNFSLLLVAFDGGTPPKSGSITINVQLTDLNDNAPVFTHPGDTIRLIENRTFQQPVYTVRATDADTGINSKIHYSLKPSIQHSSKTTTTKATKKAKDSFVLDSETGELYIHSILDYENYSQRQMVLEIVASDGGKPTLSSTFSLTILVTDINDNPPQVQVQVNNTIMENAKVQSPALQLLVTDADEVSQGKVTCHIENQEDLPLKLEGETFISIWTTEALDYEKSPLFHFNLVCHDAAEPSANTTFPQTIQVGNVNDNTPVFYSAQNAPTTVYDVEVSEAEATLRPLFQPIAIDDDGDSVTYKMKVQDAKVPFDIKPDTGAIYLKSALDYETEKKHSFYVLAQDVTDPTDSPRISSALVRIKVKDVNDNAPVLVSSLVIPIKPETPPGYLVSQIAFKDADMDGLQGVSTKLLSQETFPKSTLDRHFALKENGALLLLKPLNRESTSVISLVVLAKDLEGDKQLSSTATLAVVVENPGGVDTLKVARPFPGSTIRLHLKRSANEAVYSETINESIIPIDIYDNRGKNKHLISLNKACNGSKYFMIENGTSSLKPILTESTLASIKNLSSGAKLLVCLKITDEKKPHRTAGSSFYAEFDWAHRISGSALWPADAADVDPDNRADARSEHGHSDFANPASDSAALDGTKPFKLSLGNIVMFLLILVFSLAVGFALFAAILWARAKRATSAAQRQLQGTPASATLHHPSRTNRSNSPEAIWRHGRQSPSLNNNGYAPLATGPAVEQSTHVHYAIFAPEGTTSSDGIAKASNVSPETGAPILAYLNLIVPPVSEAAHVDQATPATTENASDTPNTPVSCYLVM